MQLLRTGLSDRELASSLFALCLQADAAFGGEFVDAAASYGYTIHVPEDAIDHGELLIALVWLVQWISRSRPGLVHALGGHYLSAVTSLPYFGNRTDRQALERFFIDRTHHYDSLVERSAQGLDLIEVAYEMSKYALRNWFEVQHHLPRVEIVVAHLLTQWVVSVTQTVKELS
ncbi:MAG: hypothetical protein HYY50_02560 [Candidatus Kerfeldbacteria bacterium]|nr:hypothetical protein [Candidatus Kerfeldbacteria bacterium]